MTGRQSMTTILAICLTVMLASIATLQGQQNAGAQPTRVAVVNVDEVFNNLAETRSIQAEIESQGEDLAREQQQRRDEIQNLENDYSILAEGSDAAREVREQLESKLLDYEVWQQFTERKMQRERAMRVGQIYRKINMAVEQIAEREGYELVLFDEDLPDFRGAQNQQQVAARIQNRKVLHAADSLDISDRVLQRMNNEFESN